MHRFCCNPVVLHLFSSSSDFYRRWSQCTIPVMATIMLLSFFIRLLSPTGEVALPCDISKPKTGPRRRFLRINCRVKSIIIRRCFVCAGMQKNNNSFPLIFSSKRLKGIIKQKLRGGGSWLIRKSSMIVGSWLSKKKIAEIVVTTNKNYTTMNRKIFFHQRPQHSQPKQKKP